MAPTILVVGSTGNTGHTVVETLSQLLETATAFSGYRVLALTRSKDGARAQQFAKLPHIEVEEHNWVETTEDWLRERNVERVFIASHLQTNLFAEESYFHLNALRAGVKYVVRISTAYPSVRPDSKAFYQRNHWAIEAQLSSPEFEALQWTSLQPGAYAPTFLYSAAEWVKNYRKTGEKEKLYLMAAKDVPTAFIEPGDAGVVAAHLLVDDPAKHHRAKYVLTGPEDVTGEDIVRMVEKASGTKVEDVAFQELATTGPVAEAMAQTVAAALARKDSPNLLDSLKYSLENAWAGKQTTSTASKEILDMGLKRHTPQEMFDSMFG